MAMEVLGADILLVGGVAAGLCCRLLVLEVGLDFWLPLLGGAGFVVELLVVSV